MLRCLWFAVGVHHQTVSAGHNEERHSDVLLIGRDKGKNAACQGDVVGTKVAFPTQMEARREDKASSRIVESELREVDAGAVSALENLHVHRIGETATNQSPGAPELTKVELIQRLEGVRAAQSGRVA